MSQPTGPSTLSSSLPALKPKSSLHILPDSSKSNVEYSVFYWKQDKTLIEIKVPDSVDTIRDMIEATISEIVVNHNIGLSNNPELWKIYAAKKTGKKKSDLPCLDSSQRVEKTKISFFCLERKSTVMAEVNPEQVPLVGRVSKETGSGKKEKVKEREMMMVGYDPFSAKKIPSSKEIAPSKQGVGCFCWSSNKN